MNSDKEITLNYGKLTEKLSFMMAALYKRGEIVGSRYQGITPEGFTAEEERAIKEYAETMKSHFAATAQFAVKLAL
ncbi:MAG: hypothetical protein WCT49_05505 [Candidatus Paceibacterota bacterium]|jgi:hypothetical protein|nr:hypothetical protein [Candidatus Paceibacterota bacterium]